MSATKARLVDLRSGLPQGCGWMGPLASLAERALGLDQVNGLYGRFGGRGLSPEGFCAEVLAHLGVRVHVPPSDRLRLRAVKGPCIVMANHPLGGRDAMALVLLLAGARSDYRVMANSLLGPVAEMQPRMILVDPFGGEGSRARNRRPLREARAFLEAGGLLGLFPAGEVSLWQGHEGRVADKRWAPSLVRLAQVTGASVVPVHIDADSSAWLQALAWVHPTFKTPFLARELLQGPSRMLGLRVGRAVPARDLPYRDDAAASADWLRRQCYQWAADQEL